MKSILSIVTCLVCFFMITGTLFSQHYVPIEPLNKNIIYEEFTGVRCPNCPSGHSTMAQILAANPGRAFVVAYHPYNSSYTLPYAGDPDFRRHYADSLYMTPWCGTSRYMPSAFVNRRMWVPNERLTERTNWVTYGNTIKAQPSPLNVGMATSYNNVTNTLTVIVDVYYTSNVTGTHNLMVTLSENDLVAQQSGGSTNYIHKHTFRESFVGQWGDFLSENAQAGTFFRQQFTFNNSTTNYVMDNCELMAFVVSNASDEVISGIGCAVGDTTFFTPDISLSVDTLFYTQPEHCFEGLTATIKNNTAIPLELIDVQPESINPGPLVWIVNPWPFATIPYTLNPGDSVDINVQVGIPIGSPQTIFIYDSLKITSETDIHYLKLAVDQLLISSLADKNIDQGQVILYNNYPNPFKSGTTLEYLIPVRSEVKLEILDLSGNVVRLLQSGWMEAGKHVITWQGNDEHGKILPEGVYMYRLFTGESVITKRCLLIK